MSVHFTVDWDSGSVKDQKISLYERHIRTSVSTNDL